MLQVAVGADGSADSLHLLEAPPPVAGTGELLIEVAYAGINRPDILQRQGAYPPPPGASPVLGLEVSGRVAALGAGVDGWQVGDAVCALVPGGGYAQWCTTPAGQALPVPANLSLAEAAALPENWFTVWINLIEHGRLTAADRLLVHGGSSGIGVAASQLARLLGVECIVTVGSDDKAHFCQEFSGVTAINYNAGDFVARVRELTKGAGVDVILDMVGGDYVPRNLSVLRQNGRLVLIGLQRGNRAEVDLATVMRNRLVVTGSTMRPRSVAEKTAIRDALLRNVWPALAAGRARTHVHSVLPLAEAAAAHRLMESGKFVGKILLQVR
jgi:putative PIG3 family NAD(P)H quinone oxidoreductase